MGQESIMRNLAIYNPLWDGADLPTDRQTSESFIVRGARLTIALQVQEVTHRVFLNASGG
jgi:putative DNA primase/helicase